MISSAPVHWFDDIDSTSEEAKRRARTGDLGPVWIAARLQSKGRGRLGRSWVSPQGNLFTTLLMPVEGGIEVASRSPFATALAVLDACQPVVEGSRLKLKWPNDVRADGHKLCGILIESGKSQGALWLAVGIGLNIQVAPSGTDQETTCLIDLGASPALTPEHMMEGLRAAFEARLIQARDDFPGLLRDWENAAEGKDDVIAAGPAHARVEGRFHGLADDGGLILRLPDGQLHTIRTGEVELIKQVVT